MKNRRYFLLSLLMLCWLCLAVNSLYAQDSNKIKSAFPSGTERTRHPLRTDSMTPGFPEKLHDTGKKALAKPASTEKDTFAKKASSAKTTKGNNISVIGDTLRKKPVPGAYAISPDAGLHRNTDTLRQKKTVVHSFTLPSFASYSFDHYRGFVNYVLANNAIFRNTSRDQPDEIIPLIRDTKDSRIKTGLFYTLLGALFLLAILRVSFTKYFTDLFRAFFNPTLSQRQLREQLSQTPLPSFLLNLFFTVSAGIYVFLIFLHFNYITTDQPLKLIPLFILIFIIIYSVKFAFLRFSGWLFGYDDLASGYIFTLYMVNKILGVGLLPFILVLAFCTPAIAGVALNISLILVILMFIYRYIRIFSLARNKIIFNKFHFFIYLCGFEIAPVLIIGKMVLIWLNGA